MTTRIEAYGHRCFSRLSVDLNRHHVIVGTTGSGTTTLLDVSALLGDRVREQRVTGASLQARSGRTPQAGTPLELLHRQEDDTITFASEGRLPADSPERLACTSMARLDKREPGKPPRAQRTIRSCHTTMTARERNGRLPADPTLFPATSCFAQFLREDVTFPAPAWLALTLQEVASAKVPEREAPSYACFVPFSDGAALPGHLMKEELENAVRPMAIETVTQSSRSIGNSQVRVSVHSPIVPSPTSKAEIPPTGPNGDGGADVVLGQRHDGCANGAALSARGLSSPSECSCDRYDGIQTRRHLSRSLLRPLESPRPTRLRTGRGRVRHTRSIETVQAAPPSRRCSPERQSVGQPGLAGFAEEFDRRLVPIRDTRPQQASEEGRDASERRKGVLDHPRSHKDRAFDDLAFTLFCDRLRTWFPENT